MTSFLDKINITQLPIKKIVFDKNENSTIAFRLCIIKLLILLYTVWVIAPLRWICTAQQQRSESCDTINPAAPTFKNFHKTKSNDSLETFKI